MPAEPMSSPTAAANAHSMPASRTYVRGLDRRYSPKRKMAQKVLTRGSACKHHNYQSNLGRYTLGKHKASGTLGPERQTGRYRVCPRTRDWQNLPKGWWRGCVTQATSWCRAEGFDAASHLDRVSSGIASSLATPASRKQDIRAHTGHAVTQRRQRA